MPFLSVFKSEDTDLNKNIQAYKSYQRVQFSPDPDNDPRPGGYKSMLTQASNLCHHCTLTNSFRNKQLPLMSLIKIQKKMMSSVVLYNKSAFSINQTGPDLKVKLKGIIITLK